MNPTLRTNIITWLDEPDAPYQRGHALLQETNTSAFLQSILRVENAYNRTRLQQELSRCLSTAPVQPDPPTPILPLTPLISAPAAPIATPGVTQPVAGVALERLAQQLMNERTELKARLRAQAADPAQAEQRRIDALRILSIGRTLGEVYSQLNFLREHGYLPLDTPGIERDDRAQLLNLRSYVSRYKALLKKRPEGHPRHAETLQLLSGYEAEKNRLELKLNPPDEN